MKSPRTAKKKIERSPAVLIVGSILGVIGAAIATAGIIYFDPAMWIGSVLIITVGLTALGAALIAIITGERAWILIDLISPL